MKIEIKEAWINNRCMECLKTIYPKKQYLVYLEHGGVRNPWRLCEECCKKIIRGENAKNQRSEEIE